MKSIAPLLIYKLTTEHKSQFFNGEINLENMCDEKWYINYKIESIDNKKKRSYTNYINLYARVNKYYFNNDDKAMFFNDLIYSYITNLTYDYYFMKLSLYLKYSDEDITDVEINRIYNNRSIISKKYSERSFNESSLLIPPYDKDYIWNMNYSSKNSCSLKKAEKKIGEYINKCKNEVIDENISFLKEKDNNDFISRAVKIIAKSKIKKEDYKGYYEYERELLYCYVYEKIRDASFEVVKMNMCNEIRKYVLDESQLHIDKL